MAELLVVSLARAFTDDESTRMLKAKVAALGYGGTSIRTSSGFAAKSTAGPLGGVTSLEQAHRLMAALETDFPGAAFTIERQDYPDAHFVFHAP